MRKRRVTSDQSIRAGSIRMRGRSVAWRGMAGSACTGHALCMRPGVQPPTPRPGWPRPPAFAERLVRMSTPAFALTRSPLTSWSITRAHPVVPCLGKGFQPPFITAPLRPRSINTAAPHNHQTITPHQLLNDAWSHLNAKVVHPVGARPSRPP